MPQVHQQSLPQYDFGTITIHHPSGTSPLPQFLQQQQQQPQESQTQHVHQPQQQQPLQLQPQQQQQNVLQSDDLNVELVEFDDNIANKVFDKLFPYINQIQINQQAIVNEVLQYKTLLETYMKSIPIVNPNAQAPTGTSQSAAKEDDGRGDADYPKISSLSTGRRATRCRIFEKIQILLETPNGCESWRW